MGELPVQLDERGVGAVPHVPDHQAHRLTRHHPHHLAHLALAAWQTVGPLDVPEVAPLQR